MIYKIDAIYEYTYCPNDFSLNLERQKSKRRIATNLFYLDVIDHRKGLSFYKT